MADLLGAGVVLRGPARKMAGRDNGLNMLLLALLYPKGIVALPTSRNINEVARARW